MTVVTVYRVLPSACSLAHGTANYCHILRRCESCGVGYPNAQKTPTLIHASPTSNVPPEVQDGLLEVLSRALSRSVRQRMRSPGRFFLYLNRGPLSHTRGLFQRLFGLQYSAPPTVLLWSAPIDRNRENTSIRDKLFEVLCGRPAVACLRG